MKKSKVLCSNIQTAFKDKWQMTFTLQLMGQKTGTLNMRVAQLSRGCSDACLIATVNVEFSYSRCDCIRYLGFLLHL